jgi:hypothetical protein
VSYRGGETSDRVRVELAEIPAFTELIRANL